MKFNCDRCKTRYSISDDRVRGKILKIRCKNCSAVITVREGMSVAAPKIPVAQPSFGSAATTMPTPPAPPPKAPPPPAVTEWYVSMDGDQAGPFDLAGAKRWVSSRPAGTELYCWSEGFDDWLPTDKVSHFRGLRPTNGASGLMSVADPSEKTPAPLFAETMKQVTAEAPTLLEDENPFSAAYERKKRATAEPATAGVAEPAADHQLPIVSPRPSRPNRIGSDSDLPKIRGLTVPGLDVPRPEVLQPDRRRNPLLVPLIAATLILLGVLGVLIYLALTGGDDGGSRNEVRRTDKSRSGAIAAGMDENRGEATAVQPAVDAAPTEIATGPDDANGGDVVKTSTTGGSAGSAANKLDDPPKKPGYEPPPGEVDLSGAGRADEPVREGGLEPSDISAVYRKKQFAVNRCYENAIKRDPLLRVPKTTVTLKIAGSGRVTRVSIPSLAGKPLGNCLVASIGRWRFARTTDGFAGSFPIVFRTR